MIITSSPKTLVERDKIGTIENFEGVFRIKNEEAKQNWDRITVGGELPHNSKIFYALYNLRGGVTVVDFVEPFFEVESEK